MTQAEMQYVKFVNERVVADLTGRSVQTLRNDRYLRRGIPFIKMGRSVRYELADVMEYVRQNKVKTEAYK
ncbi:MAG: helix-turn-helix transcriptional regulator [Candidatus Hodarchaeales archaeon]|jgi:phage terminase Nu1 subunit (DNA packaging protein)